MKILVVKTDVPLDRGAKEKMRREIEGAIKTGIVIVDAGLDLATIEVDEPVTEEKSFSSKKNVTGFINDEESILTFSKKEPPLLQIELDDIDSAPRIFHKGKQIDLIISANFSYLTNDDSTINPTHIDIEYVDKECKFGTKAIVHNRHFKRQEGAS